MGNKSQIVFTIAIMTRNPEIARSKPTIADIVLRGSIYKTHLTTPKNVEVVPQSAENEISGSIRRSHWSN
jgi:hypothetical protein